MKIFNKNKNHEVFRVKIELFVNFTHLSHYVSDKHLLEKRKLSFFFL